MISEDHQTLVDRWLFENDKREGRPSDPGFALMIMRRPTHAWEDLQEALRCTAFVKMAISNGDVDGAKSWATVAYKWGAKIKKEEYEEIMRQEKERKMDNCVYYIELHRCQAKSWEDDAKNAAHFGDLKNSRALLHAAMMEWRTVEAYQQTLLDLTRE